MLTAPQVTAVPFFMGLGDLPGGIFYSAANAVSADGSVVVGTSFPSNRGEAFRWSLSTGMVGLGNLGPNPFQPAGNSAATGVSADGSVIVGSSSSSSGGEAFRSTPMTGMVGLGNSPGQFGSQATSVSADGSVVAGYSNDVLNSSNTSAFVWTLQNGMTNLGTLPGGASSQAFGVSGNGQVVVGCSTSSAGNEAFRWTSSDGMVSLGDLPGGQVGSIAYAASGDGSVIVGSGATASTALEATRWTASGGMVGLGFLPGDNQSRAQGVSGDGAIVVGTSIRPSNTTAFIWDSADGMRDLAGVLANQYHLDLGGWQRLTSANAISANGLTVVGNGTDPFGNTQAWIASLDPTGTTADNPLLPTVTDTGWQFQFVVGSTGQTIFVDPLVAVGYDFIVDSGPNFQSILLPDVGDGLFDLYLFDGNLNDWVFQSVLAQGSLFDFGPGGVGRFRIQGIETSAGLDPNDVTAFVTGLTFAGTGPVSMRQIPLTQDVGPPVQGVPEIDASSGTCALTLLAGGLGLAGERRRRGTGSRSR